MWIQQDWGGTIIHSNQFGFSAAPSVELLLQGLGNGKSVPISHSASSVALEIRMHCKRTVNMPLEDMQVIGGQCQFVLNGFVNKFHHAQQFAPIICVGGLDSGA